jgi:hypothetical protein
MTLYNRYEEQYRRLCSYARTFAQIADQSIFSQISEHTTPAQFDLALQNLKALCERLEAQVDLFHYPAAYGQPHSCVRDLYLHAAAHLENLAIMHVPVQPPPPKQQLITREGAVIDLEEHVQTSSEETDMGTEDSSPT